MRSLPVKLKQIFKKQSAYRNTITIAAVFVLVFVAITTIVNLKNKKIVEAAWMDDNWAYRQRIVLNNNTSTSAYFNRVNVAIDTSTPIALSRMQSDCGDSRFTNQGGEPLAYFIASGCNSTTTQYWILVDHILGTAPTIVYHYYGAPNASDGTQAIQFSETQFSFSSSSVGTGTSGPAPTLFYNFNQGTNDTCIGGSNDVCDGTLNRYDGAITNGSLWITSDICVNGNCLLFDGSDDVVTVTNANGIDLDGGLSSGFTISMWIRPMAAGEGGTGQIFQKGTNTWLQLSNESAGTVDLSGSVDLATTDATLTVGTKLSLYEWHHVTLTYSDDADDEISIYVDGVFKGTSTNGVGSLAADSNSLLLGGTTTANYDGFMDDFKIYPFEKTSSQLLVDYEFSSSADGVSSTTSNYPTYYKTTKGLVGYWTMEETSGVVADISGNSNTLTNTGTDSAPGKFGAGKRVDYTDSPVLQILNASAPTLSLTSEMTLSMWAYVSYPGFFGELNLISKSNATPSTSNNYWFYVRADSDDYLRFSYRDSGGTTHTYSSGILTGIRNTWHLYTITYKSGDANSIVLYVDGQVVPGSWTSGTGTGALSSTTDSFKIAGDVNGAYYHGFVDETRVYNKYLDQKTIQELYNFAPAPVAYWKFDEGTGSTTYDSSTNNNTGTFQSSPVWTTGKYGKAIDFSSSTSGYVSMVSSEKTKLYTESFTISGWIYPRSYGYGPGTFGYILINTNGVTANYSLSITGTSSTLGVSLNGGATRRAALNAIKLNVWQHIAVTFDANGGLISFYVNGVPSGTDTEPLQPLNINNSSYIGNYTDGIIDDLKLYDYIRTNSQIIDDYAGKTSLNTNQYPIPTVNYKFDEEQGSIVYNNNNLLTSISGAFGTTNSAPLRRNSESCKVNGCLYFDGSNDMLAVTASGPINQSSGLANGFTYTTWINANGTGTGIGGPIFIKGGSNWLRTGALTGSYMNLSAAISLASSNAVVTATAVVRASAWQHVALSYSDDADDEITLWVNGKPMATSTGGSGAPATDTVNLIIGGSATNHFNGRMDEFHIYNYELTQAQMQVDMNQGALNAGGAMAAARTSPLGGGSPPLHLYHLDENNGRLAVSNKGFGISAANTGGSIFGGVTWAPGKFGAALLFGGSSVTGGSNTYVSTFTDPITETGAYSVSFWTYLNSVGSGMVFLGSGTTCRVWMPNNNSIRYQNSTNLSTGFIDSNANAISAGQWFHVLLTYSGSSTGNFFINGIKSTSDAANGETNLSGQLIFGNFLTTASMALNGYLDEIKVFNYELTPLQAWYNYSDGKPMLRYKFDECQGSVGHNTGMNPNNTDPGNHATINIGANGSNTLLGYCNSGNAAETWNNGTVGKLNNALDFDGLDDYATVASHPGISMGNSGFFSGFTWAAWIYPRGQSGPLGGTIFSKGSTYLSVSNPSNGILSLTGLLDLATTDAVFTVTNVIPYTAWTHVAMSYSNDGDDEVTYWINGNPIPSVGVYSGDPLQEAAQLFGIGSFIVNPTTRSNPFNGKIDDVQMFPVELTKQEILKVMNENASARWGPATGEP